MTSSYLLFLVSVCFIASNYAQQACPSIAITQNLRTTWQSGGDEYYLYDITATNNYDVAVTNVIFTIDHNVSQFWNLVELPGSASAIPFTFVVTGAPSAVTIAPGQSWTGSGFVSDGPTAAISGLVTCTGPAAASSSSESSVSSTTGSSTVPASSSSESTACSSTLAYSLADENAPAPTWNDSTYQYTEFTFTATNTGSETASSMSVAISYNTAFGVIGQTWNMVLTSTVAYGGIFNVSLFELPPGQTFSQAGIIFQVPLSNLGPNYHQGHYDYPYSFDTISTQC